METSARKLSDRTKNLVGFLIGEIRYAVDILRVKEIINPLGVVPMPHAPDVVLGVADHRGAVVPVVDLRRRLGLPAEGPSRRTKWIIVDVGGRSIALVVDAVTDVFGAGPADQRQVPSLGPGDEARGIQAVYVHEGALVFVIDVDLVASPAMPIDVAAAVAAASAAEEKR